MSSSLLNKVSILAVGVGKFINSDIQPIPTTRNDTNSVYDVLSSVVGDAFDSKNSLILNDVTSNQFITHFNTFISNQDPSDLSSLSIIYLSCHAKVELDVLEFHFTDKSGHLGVVSAIEIGDILRRYKYPPTLFILDCCYAESARSLAQSTSFLQCSKTSILTSCKAFQQSGYDEYMSHFTRALIEAIQKNNASGESISLNSLAQYLESSINLESQAPCYYYQQGKSDLQLKRSFSSPAERDNLIKDFCKQVTISPTYEREVLWYALAEEKEAFLLSAALQGINALSEPSWLVRRAAGSALSAVNILISERQAISAELLKSNNWMNICIGIISARKDLSLIENSFFHILQSDCPMDAKWLALLYAADHFGKDIFNKLDLGKTGFLESNWGLCELWERALHRYPPAEVLKETEELLKRCPSHSHHILIRYVYLKYRHIYHEFKTKTDVSVSDLDGFSSVFSRLSERGSKASYGVRKWFNSRLYGSWRGTYATEIPHYLNSLTRKNIFLFLETSRHVPDTAFKMAIFEQLRDVKFFTDEIYRCLEWGLSDQHPWVRRATLEWIARGFRHLNNLDLTQILKTALVPIDRNIYPGILDLLNAALHLANLGGVTSEKVNEFFYAAIKNLSMIEIDALNHECEVEFRPYSLIFPNSQ